MRLLLRLDPLPGDGRAALSDRHVGEAVDRGVGGKVERALADEDGLQRQLRLEEARHLRGGGGAAALVVDDLEFAVRPLVDPVDPPVEAHPVDLGRSLALDQRRGPCAEPRLLLGDDVWGDVGEARAPQRLRFRRVVERLQRLLDQREEAGLGVVGVVAPSRG